MVSTYSDIESLNSLEEANRLALEIRRAAGVLSSGLLEQNTFVVSTGSPKQFHLLLVKVVDHHVALDVENLLFCVVAEITLGEHGCRS
jgi:hypothetical protein